MVRVAGVLADRGAVMEFRGWRLYTLQTYDGKVRLSGVRNEWTSAVFTAVCHGGDISECPMETGEEYSARCHDGDAGGWPKGYSSWHGCGVHSFKTLASLLNDGAARSPEVQVLAEVVNYGRVDEFESGYRAEHTRIVKMYLVTKDDYQADYMEALRRILETRFGVTTTTTTLKDLIVEHAPGYFKPAELTYVIQSGLTVSQIPQMWGHAVVTINGKRYAMNATGAVTTWPTSASASSATTTSPNQSQRRSGNQSKNQSPSTDKPTKKQPVEAKLPGGKKKWWLNR